MEQQLIRLANKKDLDSILKIVEDARVLARSLGSKQWLGNDGYPNKDTFEQDIKNNQLYVLQIKDTPIAICVISRIAEPTYKKIYQGSWLTKNIEYLVIHRLAVKKEYYKKGLAVKLLTYAENLAKKEKIKSIRIDTSKENQPMLRLVEKMNYKYCGIIKLNKYLGEEDNRLAFEKII